MATVTRVSKTEATAATTNGGFAWAIPSASDCASDLRKTSHAAIAPTMTPTPSLRIGRWDIVFGSAGSLWRLDDPRLLS